MITFAALCQVSLLGADLKSLDQGLTDLTVKLLPKAIFYRGENIYIYIYVYIYICIDIARYLSGLYNHDLLSSVQNGK